MKIFEIIMLICFGVSWPVSIYKSYTSKNTSGKSIVFLIFIFVGYISGVIYKLTNTPDYITFIYMFNGLMVLIDIILYFRNKKFANNC